MKRRIAIRIMIGVCAAYAWWGILYPELTLTPDTYVVVDEDGTVHEAQNMVEWDFNGDIYRVLLEADSDQICFKSKLLTQIDALTEHLK